MHPNQTKKSLGKATVARQGKNIKGAENEEAPRKALRKGNDFW